MTRLFTLLVLLAAFSAFAWTKTGTVYTTDGSQTDVNSAYADANYHAGDYATMPAGTFTYGVGGLTTHVPAGGKLIGAGASTHINLDPAGPTLSSGGVIFLQSGSVCSNLVVYGTNANIVTTFYCSGQGWIIANTTFNSPSTGGGYYAFVSEATNGSGLAFSNTVNGNNGSLQAFMIRGGTDFWTLPPMLGTTNATYLEDNIKNGQGELVQAEGSARYVYRNNTDNGQGTVDSHQTWTSTDTGSVTHGCRAGEVYGNTWTSSGFFDSMWFFAGDNIVFNNTEPTGASGNWFHFGEYGALASTPVVTNGVQNIPWLSGNGWTYPTNIPWRDQIGTGVYPQSFGQEPNYFFNNLHADGSDFPLTIGAVSAQAISAYGSTFTMSQMVVANRDYYYGQPDISFTGATGIGIGTKAQMQSISSPTTGVGFWVTNDTGLPVGAPGRLYTASGGSWVAYYTPLTYPHPLRTVAATVPAPTAVTGVPTWKFF